MMMSVSRIFRLDFIAHEGMHQYRIRKYFLSGLDAINYIVHLNASNIPAKALSLKEVSINEFYEELNKEQLKK